MRERLPGDAGIREVAAESFAASGLPGLREEAWKYTSLRPVAEAAFHEPLTLLADCGGLLGLAPHIDAPRLVFCGGRFRADLSVILAPLRVTSFASAPQFGPLARPAQEKLVALNTMLAEDGAIIEVPAGEARGMLVRAFLTEALDPIGNAAARAALEDTIEAWWQRGAA